jgi:hypothetical protein
MNHARLFEELLLELQTLINSDHEYDVVKTSRVLRQLLLDGDALLHIVNRELRATPQLGIFESRRASEDHFDPKIYPSGHGAEVATLNLQKFLSHSLGQSDGKSITVREVIKFGAIVLGGVHFKEDSRGEFSHLSALHNSTGSANQSAVLVALKHIGAVTRDALIPIRDQMLTRERFEQGKGWTTLLSLRLLPVPADEENYILDLGTHEHEDRFSIYVDSRGELTFRIVDAAGGRRYLRAGRVGQAVPLGSPIIILCEMSTVGDESLLSIRTDGWDHAEVVAASAFEKIGDPFHFVTGSDCLGRKHTHMDQFGTLLIARPLSGLETAQAVSYFSEKAAEAEHWVRFSGNQFLHSGAHPNFPVGSA